MTKTEMEKKIEELSYSRDCVLLVLALFFVILFLICAFLYTHITQSSYSSSVSSSHEETIRRLEKATAAHNETTREICIEIYNGRNGLWKERWEEYWEKRCRGIYPPSKSSTLSR